MLRRVLPVALALGALLAEGRGHGGLARDLLLLGVLAGAGAALALFGDLVEARAGSAEESLLRWETGLGTAATCFLLLSAGLRDGGPTPALAVSALVAALAAYAAQAVAGVRAPGEEPVAAAPPEAPAAGRLAA